MTSPRQHVSLDGLWRIRFDPGNEGIEAGWHLRPREMLSAGREIIVPSCWEQFEQDYEGVAWYARTLSIPRAWLHRHVALRFGAVNYRAEVWVNGTGAGAHDGGYTPFELEVGDLLQEGGNVLIVRVIGPIIYGRHRLDGIGPNETPHWRGALAGGIWQGVELVVRDPAHIADVFIEPDLPSQQATAHITLRNTTGSTQQGLVELTVRDGDGALVHEARGEVVLPMESTTWRRTWRIEAPRPWGLEHPHLYTAEVKLQRGDEVLDVHRVRFGMRHFSIEGDGYRLNGEPFYMKAGFWEGLYPTTLANPDAPATVYREFELAREAGFNTMRPWRKPLHPWILDMADEMGMCIIAAPPVECMDHWPRDTPHTAARVLGEIEGLVRTGRNHACILYWELFNEILHNYLKRLKPAAVTLARSLDASRLIVDESGGWTGAHAYPPRSLDPLPINELHLYLRSPVDTRIGSFLRRLVDEKDSALFQDAARCQLQAGGPVFISEIGKGGLPDLEDNLQRYRRDGNPLTPDYRYHHVLHQSLSRVLKQTGVDALYPSLRDYCLATQQLQAEGTALEVEAIRLNGDIRGGYCVHAFTDGDWILGAGALDMFRNPKLVFESLKRVNAPTLIAVMPQRRNAYIDQSVRTEVAWAHEGRPRPVRIAVEVTDAQGRVLLARCREVTLSRGAGGTMEMEVPAGREPGRLRITAAIEGTNGPIAATERWIDVYPAPMTDGLTASVIDPADELTPHMQRLGIGCAPYDGETPAVVVVACEDAADETGMRLFTRLLEQVERGATAIFLRPPLHRGRGLRTMLKHRFGRQAVERNRLLESGVLPFPCKGRANQGLWFPLMRIVMPDPIFQNMPAGGHMDWSWADLAAPETMLEAPGRSLIPVICYWARDTAQALRGYRGPDPFEHSSDLSLAPHGRGRMVLSTLRILENLGRDPLADHLLRNLIHTAGGGS